MGDDCPPPIPLLRFPGRVRRGSAVTERAGWGDGSPECMYAKWSVEEAEGARKAGDKSVHPWAFWKEGSAKEGLPGGLKLDGIGFLQGKCAPNEGPPGLVSGLTLLL